MLKAVPIGSYGLNYFRQKLSMGNTLANLILKRPLESGKVFTFLPPEFANEAVQNPELSVDLTFGVNISYEFLERVILLINEFLEEESHYLIIETFAHRTDPFRKYEGINYFFFQDEVYYYVEPSPPSHTGQFVNVGREYPRIWTLSKTLDSQPILNEQELSEEFLDQLATQADFVLVGAFDEEGFLIWQSP